MTLPEVTVVIPTYNRRHLLERAINSVLEQTFQPFELIVVDDASEDRTWEYLQRVIAEDSRVSAVGLDRHLGMPGAVRNRGVAASSGGLIAFLDSDDRWLPDKLEKQVPFHREGRPHITHTRELWLRKGKRVSQKGQTHRREGALFMESLKKCIIGPSTVMLDRELFDSLGGFDETLEIAEDYELWLRVTAREKVGYLDEALTEKIAGHGDQLSERYGQIEGFRIEALRRVLDSGVLPAERIPAAREELASKLRLFALGARKRGRQEEADALEVEAASLDEKG